MVSQDPRARDRGFTLIELMIVVAIIAIIASIAVPNLVSARLHANESAAISTLKNISSAQAQCHASGIIDVNGNGAGEYGYLGEVAGAVTVRGSGQRVEPQILSSAFGNLTNARATRSGYLFQMYLPSATGAGVAEDATGGDVGNDNGVSPPNAEIVWCCYAWPVVHGSTGLRAFFINQAGDVLSTNGDGVEYSGASPTPAYDAAFVATGSSSLTERVAGNTRGRDANLWVVVQ